MQAQLQAIKAIKDLIESDSSISYAQIIEKTSLSYGTVNRIIHDHLKLRKLTSRWVPHKLTDSQKSKRLLFCKQNLAMFTSKRWRICDIITCDESWVYYRQLKHKQNNKTWCYKGEPPKTVVRREQHEPKSLITVYFKSTGMVFVDVMEKNKTIDNRYYIQKSLKPAFIELKRQRPTSGLKNVKLLHDNASPLVH